MTWLMLLGTCCAVGWLAQSVKGRTGVVWAALTLVPCGLLWAALALAGPSPLATAAEQRAGAGTNALLEMAVICLLGGGLMLVLVLTLPKRPG